MNRLLKSITVLAAAAAVVGCEGMGRSDNYTGPHATYVAPDLPKDQVATLDGTWGTWIESVDDVQLPTEKTYFPANIGGLGGNTTRVLPGPRRVSLFVTQDSTYYRTEFTFEFQPGHEYEMCRALNVYDDLIRIHDKTTGDLRYVR